MGRNRAAQHSSSNYITAEGAQGLRRELSYLWRVKRPQVTQAVSEAAALGDRSENAEYIYGKKQLREIDRRIRYLQKRLDQLIVVENRPADEDRIFFGAWVRLEDEEGAEHTYRIVGADEIDTGRGWISIDSPVARALLKHTQGDEVTVQLPKGQTRLIVIDVSYVGFDDESGRNG